MQRVLKYFVYIIGSIAAVIAVSWVIYMPDSAQRGAWRAETGGSILELTPLKATLFSETSHSCLEVLSFPAHLKLVEILESAKIELIDTNTLQLVVDGTLDHQRYARIDQTPERCSRPNPQAATARAVFDAVWTAMDENYAFFDLHGVDWAARRERAPAPDAQLDDAELTNLLLHMMEGIDDGHVHFGTDQTGYASPATRPDWIPEGESLNRNILRNIAIANAGTTLTQAANAPIFYGLRGDGTGFIMIREMDVAIPLGGNSTDAMANAFDEVLRRLADARSLVIDIRYNPGGSDTVSFGVASHFIDEPRPVFIKTTRTGETQSAPFTAILEPFDDSADGRPVVLLTSNLTGSAAEILTLAMREIPHVVTMGEETSGGLSDVMGFMLPNGWGLGLSNQTYLTMDGQLFEGVGIPPDLPIAFETPQYLAGRDPVLAAAFAKAAELGN